MGKWWWRNYICGNHIVPKANFLNDSLHSKACVKWRISAYKTGSTQLGAGSIEVILYFVFNVNDRHLKETIHITPIKVSGKETAA